jgi:hypothetical protein
MSSFLTPQLQAALERALIVALPAGALAGLASYTQTGSWKTALLAGVLAFFGAMAVRGVGEGLYDAYRQAHNLVKPSDVQHLGPPASPGSA